MKALEIKFEGGDESPWSTPGTAPVMDSCQPQTMLQILFDQGRVQKDVFSLHDTQQLFCPLHCFSASFFLIYFHFLGYVIIKNLLNNKDGAISLNLS